jgi:Cu-Zn family superoxide dismutase
MKTTARRIIAGTAGLVLAATPTAASACPDQVVRASGIFGTSAYTYDQAQVPAGARISVRAVYVDQHKTIVTLRVQGLLPNHEYGSHAHQNACGPLATDAGAHFQHVVDPVQPSVDPTYANPRNEIWLDFTTDRRGNGWARSVVRWQFDTRRAGSVVIHDHHTATDPGHAGTAGPRYGCLTVPF